MHMSAFGGGGLPDGARTDRVSGSNFDHRIGHPGHAERHGPGRHNPFPRPAVAVVARAVTGFLKVHPGLAQMPLGRIAGQLTVAGARLEDGEVVDPETMILASRIEIFISNHPRLAHSEFGSAVLGLAEALQNPEAAPIMDAEPFSDEAAASAGETEPTVFSGQSVVA